jgi:DNA-binding MarR family transcriptional regulator
VANSSSYRDLMRLLHRAALLSDRVGERMFHDRIGAGRAVYLLLRTVDETPGGVVSQQSLAGRLGLTKGAVSRHAATAQHQGWLTTAASPISRRENALVLTQAGRELVERGRAVQAEYERHTSEQLSDTEITVTVKTLTVICDLLEDEERR